MILMAYRISGSSLSQFFSSAPAFFRAFLIVPFNLIRPLASGWYGAVLICEIPRAFMTSFVNFAVNFHHCHGQVAVELHRRRLSGELLLLKQHPLS